MKKIVAYLLSSQTKRDVLSFFLTFLIYLPLLIWWSSQMFAFVKTKNETNSPLSLDLNSFHKEECIAPSVPDEPIEEEKEESVEEPAEEEPVPEEPVPEEPIIEEIVPEPVEVLSEKPKPLEVDKPKVVKPAAKKKKVKKITPKKKKTATRSRTSSTSGRSGSSAGKSQFIARLKAKINAGKTYPRIAQKRGMQGSVKVRFRITSAGKVSSLTASGPRIFIKSAKRAVRKAFPISTRGASLPMNVTFTLKYHLKK